MLVTRFCRLVTILGGLGAGAGVAAADPNEEPTEVTEDAAPEVTPAIALPFADDLIGARGLRPVEKRRVEALVSTGSYGTQRAAMRATERRGRFGFELTGNLLDGAGYVPIAPADRGLIDGAAAHAQYAASARIEHSTDASRARVYGGWSDEHVESGTLHQSSDAAVASYGASWTLMRTTSRLDVHVFGDEHRLRTEIPLIADDRSSATIAGSYRAPISTQGAHVTYGWRRVRAFDVDHEIIVGVGLERASGESTEVIDPTMPSNMTMLSRTVRGEHRFVQSYIQDTIRVIQSLDISTGFTVERWNHLNSNQTTTYGSGDEMDEELSALSQIEINPRLGVLHRVSDDLAIRGAGYRKLRAPSPYDLYRPTQLGNTLIAPNQSLRPESVWGVEVGPQLTAGPLEARATMFWNEVDSPINTLTLADGSRQRANVGHARELGVEAAASFRPAKAWQATVTYTFAHSTLTRADDPALAGNQLAQTPRHRAGATLTFDDPKLVTLTGGVRYVDRQFEDDRNSLSMGAYTLVDAVAARKITAGLAGYLAVDNILDRRYVTGRTGVDTLGEPRTILAGVRLDSARF